MNTPLEIECTWLPSSPGDVLEQGTQAALSIFVNGGCVTEFQDRFTNKINQSPGLSALRLAKWLAVNWWRLRWEPDRSPGFDWEMSHSVAAVGGGYLWPALSFSSDGDSVLVHSLATPACNSEPIRYLQNYTTVIKSAEFEKGVDDFVGTIIERLSHTAKEQPDLKELWAEVNKERKDPELYELRKLEACLGYDPAEAPAPLIEALQIARGCYGASAVHELAAASQDQAVVRLRTLNENVQSSDNIVHVANYDTIMQRHIEESSQYDAPWRQATQAAQIARDIWGLPHGPVKTETMTDLFGVKLSHPAVGNSQLSAELRGLSAGLRDNDTIDGFRVLLHQPRETGRRFALARLVGDQFIAPPDEPLLPATPAKTSRQKFQRGFAQEFLCPIDDLKDFLNTEIPTDEDIDDAAAHFEVSPLTVRLTLVNKGILPRETLSEWAV